MGIIDAVRGKINDRVEGTKEAIEDISSSLTCSIKGVPKLESEIILLSAKKSADEIKQMWDNGPTDKAKFLEAVRDLIDRNADNGNFGVLNDYWGYYRIAVGIQLARNVRSAHINLEKIGLYSSREADKVYNSPEARAAVLKVIDQHYFCF